MYLEHFGLKQKPFNQVPDPQFLYFSPNHKKAMTLLEYAVTYNVGFTVITGEIGAGKTTLIRGLLKHLTPDFEVGLINNTHSSFGELMNWIIDAFEIPSTAMDNAGRYRDYINFVMAKHAHGKRLLLIVDEAQNLTSQALEELRLLSNVNIDADIFIQLILTGQPELVTKLNQPELTQFAQRIGVEFHLTALSYAETLKYIRYRMLVAGAKSGIFTHTAMTALYYYSGGIPRRINSLCDFVLVYAFADDKKVVDIELVMEMMRDKRHGAVIENNGSATQSEEVIEVRNMLVTEYAITLP